MSIKFNETVFYIKINVFKKNIEITITFSNAKEHIRAQINHFAHQSPLTPNINKKIHTHRDYFRIFMFFVFLEYFV